MFSFLVSCLYLALLLFVLKQKVTKNSRKGYRLPHLLTQPPLPFLASMPLWNKSGALDVFRSLSGRRTSLYSVGCGWRPRKERTVIFSSQVLVGFVWKKKLKLVFVVSFSLFLSFGQAKERKMFKGKNALINSTGYKSIQFVISQVINTHVLCGQIKKSKKNLCNPFRY